ncbi:hypothetical protein E3N88_26020 [Mikania micrantha]|uniref:CBS domain-containing protein n=1 Tax=Mikania micrantha TaxID=192012 RepID=A0A5N6N953_9ASTR|nr:hypothetical protein E3N88_26020 [Mikania micrantha]
MTSRHGSSSRGSTSLMSSSSLKKKVDENGDPDYGRKALTDSRSSVYNFLINLCIDWFIFYGSVPETSTIYEACCRMAAKKVDALLLTDSNALLSGILTDKDVATRVIAHEIDFMNIPASKVMTKNPIYVLSDTLAVDALQKMVQGL